MTDAEVAEAQLDRFRRDHEAGVPGLVASSIAEIPIEAAGRIHRGLRPSELSLYRQETGESRPPGWLSVVAAAAPLAADTLDLQRVPARELNQLSVHHWYPDAPLQHMLLRPRSRSLEGRLPERDDVYPRYLLRVWDDGLMEFGTMLKLAIQPTPPDTDRWIATRSVAEYVHDYVALFGAIYEAFGYRGTVVVRAAFDHVKDHRLGVPGHVWEVPTVRDEPVEGKLWTLPAASLDATAGLIAKDALDRLFRAGGFEDGASRLFTEEGELKRA